jgi:hypothetical protein
LDDPCASELNSLLDPVFEAVDSGRTQRF